MLIRNKMAEMYYGFTVDCVDLCKTHNKDYLENEDKICLQNCGYNRMYINKIFTEEATQTLMSKAPKNF